MVTWAEDSVRIGCPNRFSIQLVQVELQVSDFDSGHHKVDVVRRFLFSLGRSRILRAVRHYLHLCW